MEGAGGPAAEGLTGAGVEEPVVVAAPLAGVSVVTGLGTRVRCLLTRVVDMNDGLYKIRVTASELIRSENRSTSQDFFICGAPPPGATIAPKPMAPDAPPAVDEDPIIEAQIQRALLPYQGLLPLEDLALFREMLSLYLHTDPDVAPLVDRLRRTDAQRSGTVEQESAQIEQAVARMGRGRR